MAFHVSMRRLGLASALITSFALGACAGNPPPAPSVKPVSFAAKPPIKLNVSQIRIQNDYVAPASVDHLENSHQITPVSIAEGWGNARLVAVGRQGTATMTILDGSVVSERLPTKTGFAGFVSDEPDTKLTGTLRARINVLQPGMVTGYSANVVAKATRTVLKSASLNERDEAYSKLMQSLASQFDTSFENEIRASMSPVIVR